MPHKRSSKNRRKSLVFPRRLVLAGLFVLVIAFIPFANLRAATLSSASVGISDPRPSNLSTGYTFTGSSVSLTAIRCIRWTFADTPSGSTVPAGLTTNSAGVTYDTANTNYVPTPGAWSFNKTTNGTFLWTNAGGETPASAAARRIAVTGITNSSLADTKLFLRVNTYSNADCSTGPVDNATVGYIHTNASTLSLTVDETLTFTVNAVAAGQTCNGATSTRASTATTIPFGTVSTAANSITCQDLQASTNATNGYTVSTRYTAAPTNALGQVIAAHSAPNATPAAFSAAGIEAYGYTTSDTTLGTGTVGRFGGGNWAGMTTTNAEVGYESTGVTTTTYRVGHQVGVSPITRPGTYTTTVVYTCTPVY